MSEFRKLVENILKEDNMSGAINELFQFYANELNENRKLIIKDESECKAFLDYCYRYSDDLPFSLEDLVFEGNTFRLI